MHIHIGILCLYSCFNIALHLINIIFVFIPIFKIFLLIQGDRYALHWKSLLKKKLDMNNYVIKKYFGFCYKAVNREQQLIYIGATHDV